MQAQLLCTFSTIEDLSNKLALIYQAYQHSGVANLKQFYYIHSPDEVVCIYNVADATKRIADTITINRKKESNTLYSINALNSLIKQLNHGILDKSFAIKWQDYQDTMLLADREKGFKMIKIKEMA